MKSKIAIFIFVSFCILGYLFFPKYIIHSDDYGYKIADSYAREYYIDCERPALYKKKAPEMDERTKDWLRNNTNVIYEDELKEFDQSTGYYKAITSGLWIDSFKYKYTFFDVSGDVDGDTYESIFFINGLYYHFQYTPRKGDIQKGYFASFRPSTERKNYSYDFDVDLAKKSCSHPQ